MRKLLDFLYRRRNLAIFVGLEIVCVWLIVNFNQRQNADFLNSSNAVAARVSTGSQNVSDYFALVEINRQLMSENEQLSQQLNRKSSSSDSLQDFQSGFTVMGARVINNTFRRPENYITINRGRAHGVLPGMGVISPAGVVGQVKSASDQYATIFSLLHPNVIVSSVVKRTNTHCSVQWDQENYDAAQLKYVPKHIDLQLGDTIITSGYNSVFPADLMVGIVMDLNLEDHMTFHEARIKLSTDFTSLPNVFVVFSEAKVEKDSLEAL